MANTSLRSVLLSTMSHATEDKSKVLKAIRGLSLGVLSGEVLGSTVRGHYGNEIVTLKMKSTSRREATDFLSLFWSLIVKSDRSRILEGLKDCVDSTGTLFLRIDKEESYKGNIRTATMDTIKVEVHFSVENKSKDQMLQSILKQLTPIGNQPNSE